ncbi:MAG TPA: hypothetical protein VGH67_13825, partial [Solirubrobacteraceae bacterium]
LSTCNTPSGTATATLTDQNGDKTVRSPANFTVVGCPGTSSGSDSSAPGGAGPGGAPGNAGSHKGSSVTGVTIGQANLSRLRYSALASGHPTLTFKLRTTRGAPALSAVTVELPAGLRFVAHHHRVRGVSVKQARIQSLVLSGRRLTVKLRRADSSFSVTIGGAGLAESKALKRAAQAHRLHPLRLTVIAQNTRGARTTIRAT